MTLPACMLGMLLACHHGEFGLPPIPTCTQDAECDSPYVCLDGTCREASKKQSQGIAGERSTGPAGANAPPRTTQGGAEAGGGGAPGAAAGSGGAAAGRGSTPNAAGSPATGGTPATAQTVTETSLTLGFVAPRVVYTDEARTVTLFGARLKTAAGKMVRVDGDPIGKFAPGSDRKADVSLPMLAAGAHTLAIEGSQTTLHIVSVARPEYVDGEIEVPGQLAYAFYESERGVIFAAFTDGMGGGTLRLERLRFDGTSWKRDPIEVPSARAANLSADGQELLVLTAGCVLIRVSTDTLQRLGQENTSECDMNTTLLQVFANGQRLFTGRTMNVWQASDELSVPYPFSYALAVVMAPYRTRLLVADASTGSPSIFKYDIGDPEFTAFHTLSAAMYTNENLALSGDGNRFAHAADIYDGGFVYLGSLPNRQADNVGVSGNGATAVAYDGTKQTLQAYDISLSSSPFPTRGPEISLPMDMYGRPQRSPLVDDAGRTAFIFSSGFMQPDTPFYRFIVRRLGDR